MLGIEKSKEVDQDSRIQFCCLRNAAELKGRKISQHFTFVSLPNVEPQEEDIWTKHSCGNDQQGTGSSRICNTRGELAGYKLTRIYKQD